MLVKKINPDWQPKEKPGLQVGETIDITDPKSLIISGDVVAIDAETGATISAYELYGIIIEQELDEFKAYQQQKQQERQAEKLRKEQEELQNKIKAQIAAENEAKSTETVASDSKDTVSTSIESKSWKELTELGKEKGVFKVGMKKEELITALKSA